MLNTLYDDFIRQFGNLNDRKNIDLFRMDAGNREILSLERYIDGRAVKADIFDHPVSYNINEITHTDDVHEALTASLNKYGNVDMAYMESLTDKSQSDLLEELRGRIFYNPLSKNYEIADRFISGNVMAKAEHIEEYLQSHPRQRRGTYFPRSPAAVASRAHTFRGSGFQFRRALDTGGSVQPLRLMAVRHGRVRPLYRQQ